MNACNETGPSRIDDEIKTLLKAEVPAGVKHRLNQRAEAIREDLPENRVRLSRFPAIGRLGWALTGAFAVIAAVIFTLPSKDVLAKTIEAIYDAKALIVEVDPGLVDSEKFLNRSTWVAPDLFRQDITHGDFLNETTWEHKGKVFKLNRITNRLNIIENSPDMSSSENYANMFVPGALAGRLKGWNYEFEETINQDGRLLHCYVHTTEHGQYKWLIDAVTFLPVEERRVGTAYRDGKEVGKKETITRYQWNVPIETALMVPQYPADAIVRVVDGSTEAIPHAIDPGKGVGPIRIGMARQEVEAIWGAPNEDEKGGYAWYYDHGVRLSYSLGSEVLSIGCISWTSSPYKAFSGTTTEGIGIGSTVDEVIAAFGEPGDKEVARAPDAPPRSPSNVTLIYPELGLRLNYRQAQNQHQEGSQSIKDISVNKPWEPR